MYNCWTRNLKCANHSATHLSGLISMHRKRDGCIALKIATAEMLIENAHLIQEMPVWSYLKLRNVRPDIVCWKLVKPNQSKFEWRNVSYWILWRCFDGAFRPPSRCPWPELPPTVSYLLEVRTATQLLNSAFVLCFFRLPIWNMKSH